jgi:hypothetical protein
MAVFGIWQAFQRDGTLQHHVRRATIPDILNHFTSWQLHLLNISLQVINCVIHSFLTNLGTFFVTS